MQAFVLYEQGKTELRDVPKPVCGDRDIIIKVESASICGSDLHFYNGSFPSFGKYPLILGHEFAGVIDEMGPNADKHWHVGERVISENTAAVCGRCPACEKGNYVNCAERKTMGCDVDGAFTQYVKIPGELLDVFPNCLFHLPDSIPMDVAPLLEPQANGYMAVVQEGQLMPGENVVVFGAGALGLCSVQAAAAAGAGNIILVGMPSDEAYRFPCGRELGATHTLCNTPDVDLKAEISKICGESGVALCIDAAGLPIVMHQCIDIVRYDGKIVRIGMSFREYGYLLNDISLKSVDISGHMGYNTTSWRNVINLVALGKMKLEPMVSHKIPLSKIDDGFQLLKEQNAIKVLLDPDK